MARLINDPSIYVFTAQALLFQNHRNNDWLVVGSRGGQNQNIKSANIDWLESFQADLLALMYKWGFREFFHLPVCIFNFTQKSVVFNIGQCVFNCKNCFGSFKVECKHDTLHYTDNDCGMKLSYLFHISSHTWLWCCFFFLKYLLIWIK